ncbi:MAG: hypothetical protein AAFV47_02750 [Pseudomonadota bacterium]
MTTRDEQLRQIDELIKLANEGTLRASESFLAHVRSLSRWSTEPMDYPDVSDADIRFPERIFITYAVCHPECGRREFIVDGSTQRCQRCGATMFRTAVEEYRCVGDDDSAT